jgi:hypothetical protein
MFFLSRFVQWVERERGDCEFWLSSQKYDGQRRQRHKDAPRTEEEGKGEKEGWCAGEATRERGERRGRKGLLKREEMNGWLDGDQMSGRGEERKSGWVKGKQGAW